MAGEIKISDKVNVFQDNEIIQNYSNYEKCNRGLDSTQFPSKMVYLNLYKLCDRIRYWITKFQTDRFKMEFFSMLFGNNLQPVLYHKI